MAGKNYKAEKTDGKFKCHSLLMDFIQDHLNAVTAAILSGKSLIFEEKVIKRTQWPELNLAEIDSNIYKELLVNIKNKNFENCTIIPHNKDIEDVITSKRNSRSNGYFNTIWLDYCGFLTEPMWHSIINILNSPNLSNKVVFAITLSGRREHGNDLYDFYRKLLSDMLGKKYKFSKNQPNGINLKKFREIDIPNLLSNAIETAGFNIISAPDHFSYKTSYPMKIYYFCIERK